jgi:4'-phosphopantetheinyl transferase EntD
MPFSMAAREGLAKAKAPIRENWNGFERERISSGEKATVSKPSWMQEDLNSIEAKSSAE